MIGGLILALNFPGLNAFPPLDQRLIANPANSITVSTHPIEVMSGCCLFIFF